MSKSFAGPKWPRRVFEGNCESAMLMISGGLYMFGSYRLDLSSRLLARSGESVMLAPKTFDLLALLVKSNGRLLSKSELMDSLWPGTFVEEANLSFQISTLRKALAE